MEGEHWNTGTVSRIWWGTFTITSPPAPILPSNSYLDILTISTVALQLKFWRVENDNYTCAEIETMEKLWKTNNSHMWMGHWRWVGKLNMQQTPFHSLYKYATKNTYLIHSAILQSQDNIVISDWTSISLYCTPSVPRPPWSGHLPPPRLLIVSSSL